MADIRIIGPFKQLIPLEGLPVKGPLQDDQISIIGQGGLVLNGSFIHEVGDFNSLCKKHPQAHIEDIEKDLVCIPGLIDCHTHICYGGNRAADYALRISGDTYQKILASGGGIHDTVRKTRDTSQAEMERSLSKRISRHLSEGVTTIEVKSGYGLSIEAEIRMLEAIHSVNQKSVADLVSTCLAAHVCPPEFKEPGDYLEFVKHELLPVIKQRNLTNRIDIFIEDSAFPVALSREYLAHAKSIGFDITIHADQFTTGGSDIAAEIGACTADHLEASGETEIRQLVKNNVACVVLPGASMGLGMHFAPARKILDMDGILAIATDWNPGSAPMGDLLTQASVLSASEKLSTLEVFAAITFRAARALNLNDRGQLSTGKNADFIGFNTNDYREILYNQGKMKPDLVWKNGKELHNQ